MPSRQYGAPSDPRRGKPDVGSGAAVYGQASRDSQAPKPKKEDPSPTGRIVEMFHKNDDADVRRESHHHTLGPQPAQSSPGDHNHDGGSSRKILDGYLLSGSKANPTTMWPSILQALVRLGAKDNTTA